MEVEEGKLFQDVFCMFMKFVPGLQAVLVECCGHTLS